MTQNSNISRFNTRSSQEEELELLESESGYYPQGLHYASLGEKKRLWWQNAALNAFYILAWCVMSVCWVLQSVRRRP